MGTIGLGDRVSQEKGCTVVVCEPMLQGAHFDALGGCVAADSAVCLRRQRLGKLCNNHEAKSAVCVQSIQDNTLSRINMILPC